MLKTIKLSDSGYPDLFCFKAGKAIFFEIKDKKGTVSELQKYRIEELRKENFEANVVNSYDTFLQIFNKIIE